jgi:osmotically-inducible protein OsmY
MMRLRALGPVVVVTVLLSGCAAVTGRSVGQFVNDVTMTVAVKDQIAAMQGWRSVGTIGVETHNDMVVLTGTVPDQATWNRIDEAVRWTAGSNRVDNRLTVDTTQAEARGR